VLRLYAIDKAPNTARPKETASRIAELLDHFGERTLAAVTGAECRSYASRRSQSAARRQLEDLRAAIKHYHNEGFLESCPAVVLPEKGVARERWLTRQEAARLIWSAWRAQEKQRGERTRKWTGRHLARFILVALYTGTRAGAICSASWDQFNLEAGVFHRRKDGERETKKRRPPVKIAGRLLPHLQRWKRMGGDHPVEWQGKPVKRVSKSFAVAAATAKLKGVSPHVMRHTAATWLMQAGVDLGEAAQFLGMTTQVLENTYWHHHPDFQSNAAHAIGTKRGRAKSGPTNKPEQAGYIRNVS
jgi:integrase